MKRCFRKRQVLGALPIEMLRHCLNAVDASAEVDAIQVELEDLIFAKAYSIRTAMTASFAFRAKVGHVREEERSCQLLGQSAAALGQRSACARRGRRHATAR